MRNNICTILQLLNFLILLSQYRILNVWFTFSYRSSNFAIINVILLISLLNIWYWFCILVNIFCSVLLTYSYISFNYLNSNICHLFSPLKAIAKSKGPFRCRHRLKSEKERQLCYCSS